MKKPEEWFLIGDDRGVWGETGRVTGDVIDAFILEIQNDAAMSEDMIKDLAERRAVANHATIRGTKSFNERVALEIAEIKNASSQRTQPTAAVTDAWQPIETAPKDGREILVFYPTVMNTSVPGWRVIALWRDSDWYKWGSDIQLSGWHKPTHWMPLPEPPAIERAKAGAA